MYAYSSITAFREALLKTRSVRLICVLWCETGTSVLRRMDAIATLPFLLWSIRICLVLQLTSSLGRPMKWRAWRSNTHERMSVVRLRSFSLLTTDLQACQGDSSQ